MFNESGTSGQERALMGLNDFYPTKETVRLPIKDWEEISHLETSRIYGPFSADVLHWLLQLNRRNATKRMEHCFILSVDADGREFLEY